MVKINYSVGYIECELKETMNYNRRPNLIDLSKILSEKQKITIVFYKESDLKKFKEVFEYKYKKFPKNIKTKVAKKEDLGLNSNFIIDDKEE